MEDLLQKKARMKALYKPPFIRLIYAVFNNLPAPIYRQNDLNVIRNIFRENLAVFVSGAPLLPTTRKFLSRLFTDLLKQIRR